MDDGRGDCDDYAGLFTTILRRFGIPTRIANGPVMNSAGVYRGMHAWTEVLLPLDSGFQWILVEPTWADNKPFPSMHINQYSHEHLYPIELDITLSPSSVRGSYHVFEHHNMSSTPIPRSDDPAALILKYLTLEDQNGQ